MKYCPKCGTEMQGRFCSECGFDSKKESSKNKLQKGIEAIKQSKVGAFAVAHAKPLIISAAAVLVLTIALIILISYLTNIFRIGKVSKIEVGMTKDEVEEILGEPHMSDEYMNVFEQWVYFEKKFKKQYDITMETEDWDKYEKAYEKMLEMEYKQIIITFDNENKVSEVFFDTEHQFDELNAYKTTEKTAKKVEISVADVQAYEKMDGEEVNYYTVKASSETPYKITYTDGSYYHSIAYPSTEIDASKNLAAIKWTDLLGEYSVTVGLKITYRLSEDGTLIEWKDKDAEEIILPSEIRVIGEKAFANNTNVKKVILPEGITYIDPTAFEGCTNIEYNIYENGKYLGTEEKPYLYLMGLVDPNKSSQIHEDSIFISDSYLEEYRGNEVIFSKDMSKVLYIPEDFSGSISLPDTVTEISLADSITKIPNRFFENCTGLTSVHIPDSVTSIGREAFYDCDSLTSIVIPDSVTSIGSYAFYDCDSLTSVIFGENSQLTSIGNDVFYGCDSITSIEIPDSVTSIGNYAFCDCDSLTSVIFGENSQLRSIGDRAFFGCSNLTSIDIPESVTSIGDYAFATCESLTSITIPDSVTSIGSYAFGWCYSLTSIEIPDSVTSIGNDAFYVCHSLTSVIFGENSQLTSVGNGAFNGCRNLTSIVIPDSVTSIGDYAFYECYSLTSVVFGENSQLTSIGSYAFGGCYSLTSIEIPDSVTSIGMYAFRGCSSLTIYCEVESQPSGWNSDWNSGNRPVVWGYKGEE